MALALLQLAKNGPETHGDGETVPERGSRRRSRESHGEGRRTRMRWMMDDAE